MKNRELWNKKVVRGLALGLAAGMSLASPMAALAESSDAIGTFSETENAELSEEAAPAAPAAPATDEEEIIAGTEEEGVTLGLPSKAAVQALLASADEDGGSLSEETDAEDGTAEDTQETEDDNAVPYEGATREEAVVSEETRYSSDMDQQDTYRGVDASDVADQVHEGDYVSEITDVSVVRHLVDENGEYVKVINDKGEQVILELAVDFDYNSSIQGVMYEDGTFKEVPLYNSYFLTIDESGNLVRSTDAYDIFDLYGENFRQSRVYIDTQDGMVCDWEGYALVNAQGETVYLTEDQMKALRGESSSYVVSSTYYFLGEKYDSAEELAKVLPEGTDISVFDFDLEGTVTDEAVLSQKEKIVIPAGSEAEITEIKNGRVYYKSYIVQEGITYVYTSSASESFMKAQFQVEEFAVGDHIKTQSQSKSNANVVERTYTYQDGDEVKTVTTTGAFKDVVVTLADQEGNIIWSGSRKLFEDQIKKRLTKTTRGFELTVNDYEKYGTYRVLIPYALYEQQSDPYYTKRVVTTESYTTHDKTASKTVSFTQEGVTYELEISVLEGRFIQFENAEVVPGKNGKATVKILRILTDGQGNTVSEETLEIPVSLDDMKETGKGTLSLQSTPTVLYQEDRTVEGDPLVTLTGELGIPEIIFNGKKLDLTQNDPDQEDISQNDPDQEDISQNDPDQEDISQNDPGQNTSSQTTSTATGAASASVAQTVSAATDSAVLGAERETVEETTEEGQVLGEDRPQTSDASQPMAWMGVLIASAIAALAIYKKREE